MSNTKLFNTAISPINKSLLIKDRLLTSVAKADVTLQSSYRG